MLKKYNSGELSMSMNKDELNSLLKESYGNRWALLTGVNHYSDDAISDLKVCATDVHEVYKLLIANNYHSDRIRLLLSPGESEPLPSRSEILAALSSISQAADKNDLGVALL